MLSVIFFGGDKKNRSRYKPAAVYLIQVIGASALKHQLHAFSTASSALGFRLFLDRRDTFFAILQEA